MSGPHKLYVLAACLYMRPRLPLVLLAGVFLTSILWLLVLQGNIRDRSGETVGLDGVATPLDKPSLLAVVGVQV